MSNTANAIVLPSMRVIGNQVKTSNSQEVDPQTRRIPSLWAQVADVAQAVQTGKTGKLCAVYFDYESDFTGLYSILVGVEVDESAVVPQGLVEVTAPGGKYELFQARGEMPQAVIETWGKIWGAYPTGSSGRSYKYDLEVYPENASQADIFIGLR